jgi:hypothetical protein
MCFYRIKIRVPHNLTPFPSRTLSFNSLPETFPFRNDNQSTEPD